MGSGLTIPAKDRASEGIRWLITSRGLGPGDRLPPERELCELVGVSRTALRGAIAELVAGNVLESRQGSGTYVADPRVLLVFQETYNYGAAARDVGMSPGSLLVAFGVEGAPADVAERLSLTPGDPVFFLKRVRTADGRPSSIETGWIDHGRFPGIEAHDYARESLYEVLERDYGVRISHGEERISVTRVREDEAPLLGLAPGDAALYFLAVEKDAEGRPVEFGRHIIRADRYHFASNDLPEHLKGKVGKKPWLFS